MSPCRCSLTCTLKHQQELLPAAMSQRTGPLQEGHECMACAGSLFFKMA